MDREEAATEGRDDVANEEDDRDSEKVEEEEEIAVAGRVGLEADAKNASNGRGDTFAKQYWTLPFSTLCLLFTHLSQMISMH